MTKKGCSYNVVVVGAAGSGKSCLIIRYIANRFVQEYDPTLEDSYRKFTNVDDKAVVIDIFDTAGAEDFASVRDSYIREGEGFVFTYSITDTTSYDQVISLYDHMLRCKAASIGDVPAVLVGCKADLEKQREVSQEKGAELAKQLGDIKFFETSALAAQNVEKVFLDIVRVIADNRSHKKNTPEDEEKAIKHKSASKCLIL